MIGINEIRFAITQPHSWFREIARGSRFHSSGYVA
jgi:hypothetical protein